MAGDLKDLEKGIFKTTWRGCRKYTRPREGRGDIQDHLEKVQDTSKITWRRSKIYTRSPGEGAREIQDHLGKEQDIYKVTWGRSKSYPRSLGEGARDIQDHLEKEQEVSKITWRRKRRYTRSPGEEARDIQDHLVKEQEVSKITWGRKRRYARSPGEGARYIQDNLKGGVAGDIKDPEKGIFKTTWRGCRKNTRPREGRGDIQDHLEKEQDTSKITWRRSKRYIESPGAGARDI